MKILVSLAFGLFLSLGVSAQEHELKLLHGLQIIVVDRDGSKTHEAMLKVEEDGLSIVRARQDLQGSRFIIWAQDVRGWASESRSDEEDKARLHFEALINDNLVELREMLSSSKLRQISLVKKPDPAAQSSVRTIEMVDENGVPVSEILRRQKMAREVAAIQKEAAATEVSLRPSGTIRGRPEMMPME